ncbi:MAG: ComF family protein [Caulobacter sp.]
MSAEDGPFRTRWKPGPVIIGAARRALDLILPPTALDGGPAQSAGLSAEAWSRITFVEEPVCDGCGLPVEFALMGRCAACEARPHRFDQARAACLYDEHSRDGILQFKHGDRTDLAGQYARWISRAAASLIAEADVVTPTPLHRWRLLSRRYNQSAEIARRLATFTPLAFLPDVLVRRRDTPTQGGRSASGRRRNVAGAFTVPPGRRKQVEGRRVLLIDDVLTTGATADACARALKLAGASWVGLAVVARVRGRDPV